jgi:hypothetical protein
MHTPRCDDALFLFHYAVILDVAWGLGLFGLYVRLELVVFTPSSKPSTYLQLRWLRLSVS